VIFPLVPRFGRFNLSLYRYDWFEFRHENTEPIRKSGFSDQVALGELGLLADDLEKVAEVRLIELGSIEPYSIQGDLYLRGAVVTRYDDGQWQYRGPGYPLPASSDDERLKHLVWHRITVEPMDRPELFCVWPIVLPDLQDGIAYNARTERLLRSNRRRKARVSFALPTTAIVNGTLAKLVPSERAIANTRHLLVLPDDDMPEVARLARQWIEETNLSKNDWAGRARYLESKLRDSGRFAYSAVGARSDLRLDPIEDFLINNPTGNCEYFATALALMLRTQGIPSRVVIGFKTNEYSRLRGQFTVRQSYAHTWVEAYLDSSHVPKDWPESKWFSDWSRGAWLRLDATPARDLTGVEAFVTGMENWLAWGLHLWDTYVTGLTSQRQRDVVYGPLSSMARGGPGVLTSEWWQDLWARMQAGPSGLSSAMAEAGWSSGTGLLMLIVLFVVLFLAYRGLRLVVGAAWTRFTSRQKRVAHRRGVSVPFYIRLEALLARRGLKRVTGQTQREFAVEAGNNIAESAGQAQTAELPVGIADAFYQVRFGGIALERPQRESVEQALNQLDKLVDGRVRPK
jgi:transglutaminase-like putative cysteine protease